MHFGHRHRITLMTVVLLFFATALSAQHENCRDTIEHKRLQKAMWDACGGNDPQKLELTAANYQKHALSENDLDSYYNAWVCKIVSYIDKIDIFNAYNQVQGMKNDMRQHHPKAEELFLVPNMLGQVYNACGNINGAMLEFKKAIELIKGTHYETTGLSTLYLGLAHIYMNSNLTESLHWINKDIDELGRHPDNSRYYRGMANAFAFKAMLCFKIEDYKQFRECQRQSDDYEALNHSGSSGSFRPYLKIYSEMLDGQRDKAHEDAGKLPNKKDQYIIWSDLLRYEGDFNEAFKVQRKLMHIRDSITGVMIANNIEQMDEELNLVKAEKEATNRANTILKISFFLTLMLIVVLAFYLYTKHKYQNTLMQKNRELKVAHNRVTAADKMKTEFIRNVSHEIRTPLNIINGFSQVITDPDITLGEEERSSIANTIEQNTQHITSLVNKMLALANEDSTDILSQLSETDCLKICQDAISDIPVYDPKRIKVSLDSQVATGTTIHTNADSLKRMLDSLLENAVKFTDEGRITLICRQVDATIQFIVEDTGCGISEADARHIFERFTKVDDFKEGLGLGLAYCHETAKKLGGSLSLDPDYKDGSRFILTLPKQR